MSFLGLQPFVLLVAAAAAGCGAYAARETRLLSIVLALLGAGLVWAAWAVAERKRRDELSDPALSTLVFPPESKFQTSVLPKR